MANLIVTVETANLDRRLTRLERRQLPFANVLAMTRAAYDTMQTMRVAADLLIDRPTPYTIRGIRYSRATKERPVATVYISDDAGKGTSPAEYLGPLVRGGRRGPKPGERQLQRRGILEKGWGYVPTPALRQNRYGNITRGTMQKILSAIGGFGQEGYLANITARSNRRRPGRKRYFAVPTKNAGRRAGAAATTLRPGIYERKGKRIRPVLLFVPLPSYGVQFNFAELARNEAIRRFKQHFPAALAQAVRTAR